MTTLLAGSAISVKKTETKLVSLADVRRLSVLLAAYAVTGVTPRRADRRIVGLLSWIYRTVFRGRLQTLSQRLRLLGVASERDCESITKQIIDARMEELWGRARNLHPLGSVPTIHVEGTEHLTEGLAKERGVIVWLIRSCGILVPKQGFWSAGFPLTFLHNESHGATTRTRVGLGVVARLYARPENQYLAERVVMPSQGSLNYLKTLAERLKSNACVGLTGEHLGRQNISAPFLGSRREFATGAPSLAFRHRATLVTAYCVRQGFGTYRLVVEEPVPIDYTGDRKENVHAAVQEFSKRVERFVMQHPESWQGWLVPWVMDEVLSGREGSPKD